MQQPESLDSSKYKDPARQQQRCGQFPERQNRAYSRLRSPINRNCCRQRHQKTHAVIDAAGECGPVIHRRKSQNSHNRSNRIARFQGAAYQGNDQAECQKKNHIHDRRNPKNLFRNVHHWSPALPIEPLENHQARRLHESGQDAKAHSYQKQ